MSSVALSRITLAQLLIATVVVKLLLVLLIPVTGDEAYFYIWGVNPALTFYDHPPLTGWLLTLSQGLLGWFGSPIIELRLPAIVATTLAGLFIYRHIFHYYDSELALPITAIYLLLPLNLIAGFIYTTDTLLLLFSVLALLSIDRAQHDKQLSYYLVAGIWIGLAINTKYLSAIPATAIGLYLLINMRRLGIKPVLLFVGAALPFILFNLYSNSQTCWNNIAFNLYNRKDEGGLGWSNPGEFILMLFYLTAPLVFIYFRLIRTVRMRWPASPLGQIMILALLLFFVLSIFKSVGLHWMLGITLLIISPLLLVDNIASLWRGARNTLIFSLLHILLLVGLITYINVGLDKDIEHEADIYRTYLISTDDAALKNLVKQYDYDLLAANNYSLGSIIGMTLQQPVPIIGRGSSYGRQDDFITDFRQLDGKDILIIFGRKAAPSLGTYFDDYTMETPDFGKGRIHIAIGKKFNYALYKKNVLQPMARLYYGGLPFTNAGSCSFNERYL